jgi:predicted PhzF superfamily epimerase YddE/YHI9
MWGAGNTVSIRTFCGEHQPGSLQIIHFFSSNEQARCAAQSSKIIDEFDHGFVYVSSADTASVHWRNKAGEIQFCGSGAYALTWMMLQHEQVTQAQLHTAYRTLIATLFAGPVHSSAGLLANVAAHIPSAHDGNACYLSIPCYHPVEVEAANVSVKAFVTEGAGRLYVDSASGIYLLQLNNVNKLENTAWLTTLIESLSGLDIHGFCAFYWDSKNNSGKLRYFVPWHGRDEDYVTGSIHQYLTPLVHDLYGAQTQNWQQVSSSHGSLTSMYQHGYVQLSGHCQIVSV